MAPRTRSHRGPAGRRALGTAIRFSPVRYWPVSEAPAAATGPACTTRPPLVARAGAELEHEVGLADGGEVVLDDDDGVAGVAEAAEQRQQPVGVARVQADRRLVEHVERVHQPGAERVGERDPLGLAAGQRARLAVEREVAEPDVAQEPEPGSRAGPR